MTSFTQNMSVCARHAAGGAIATAILVGALWLPATAPASVEFVQRPDVPLNHYPLDLAAADFNGDGNDDLVVCSGYAVAILDGRGDGTFAKPRRFAAPKGPTVLAVADLDRDGNEDVVTANDGRTISVLRGRGNGNLGHPADYRVGKRPYDVAVGRLNRDRWPDLVVTNARDDDVSVLLAKGHGRFRRHHDYRLGTAPTRIAIADLNGDHRRDLAIGGWTEVSILKGRGDGTFRRPRGLWKGVTLGYSEIAAGRFGHGRTVDLAISDQGDFAYYVAEGRGDGTFGPLVAYGLDSPPLAIAAADFSGDGRKDIATETEGYPFGIGGPEPGHVDVDRGRWDGTFIHDFGGSVDGQGGRFAIGDFDGSGTPDIAAATYAPDPKLEILLNQ